MARFLALFCANSRWLAPHPRHSRCSRLGQCALPITAGWVQRRPQRKQGKPSKSTICRQFV